MKENTIEVLLENAFRPHGVTVRVVRASFHAQKYLGASTRIKGFRAIRKREGIWDYSATDVYRWPSKAQVQDANWLTMLVAKVLEDLTARERKTEEWIASSKS